MGTTTFTKSMMLTYILTFTSHVLHHYMWTYNYCIHHNYTHYVTFIDTQINLIQDILQYIKDIFVVCYNLSFAEFLIHSLF